MNEFRAAFPAVVGFLDDGKKSVLRRWMRRGWPKPVRLEVHRLRQPIGLHLSGICGLKDGGWLFPRTRHYWHISR